MLLHFADKKEERDILEGERARLVAKSGHGAVSKLIHADNLAAMRALLDQGLAGKIGLVYIDPPFATNSEFRIGTGRTRSISSSKDDAIAYSDMLVDDAFLGFLWERLVLLRELMSDTGSIYLHIDYKIGHYVKVLMDEVFGRENFRNDIARIKCNPKNFDRKAYGNVKDLILFYSKTGTPTWNDPRVVPGDSDHARFNKVDGNGRRYTTIPLHAPGETMNGATGQAWRGMLPPPGRHWRSKPDVLEQLEKAGLIEWSKNGVPRKRIYADEHKGKKQQDIWEFKDPQYPSYPTEKNLDMLKLLVGASSAEGDIVVDCFAGSGTTLHAAHDLGRRFIGIDQSPHAIDSASRRLRDIGASFELIADDEPRPRRRARADEISPSLFA